MGIHLGCRHIERQGLDRLGDRHAGDEDPVASRLVRTVSARQRPGQHDHGLPGVGYSHGDDIITRERVAYEVVASVKRKIGTHEHRGFIAIENRHVSKTALLRLVNARGAALGAGGAPVALNRKQDALELGTVQTDLGLEIEADLRAHLLHEATADLVDRGVAAAHHK